MAEKQVHAHLKAVGLSELRGWAFERLATDPVAPTAGQIWENTTTKQVKYYDGTATQVLNAVAGPSTYAVALNSAEADVTRTFAGGQTTYTVAHAQSFAVGVTGSVKEISTGAEVIVEVVEVDADTIDVIFNGNSTDNTFKLFVVGE